MGVFGGPDFIVHYRNGHRTSYVMAVFEASADAQAGAADGDEVAELRYMSQEDARTLPLARWTPVVLRRIFNSDRSHDY